MKETILNKPTNLHLLKGLIISIIGSLIKRYSDAVIPDKVGKYRLIQKVNKETMLNGYAVGVYQDNEEKVFIKTWTGMFRNFGYYDLVNEYVASKIIYKKLKSYNLQNKKYRIKSPKPIKYILSKCSLSLVFEYIDGKTLMSFSINKKVEILANIIKCLSEISNALTDKEKKQLLIRGEHFYKLSLPVLIILTIVSNHKIYKAAFKAFIDCLKTLKFLNIAKLCIAHRDITLHNILVNEHGVFVVDWSRMALTVPDYDLTYMSIRPELELIATLVSEKLNYKPNSFLKNYILIHSSQSFNSPEGYDNFYAKQLYKLYA